MVLIRRPFGAWTQCPPPDAPGQPDPPGPTPARRSAPVPLQWIVRFFVDAVATKIAAANMTDPTGAGQIITATDQAIADFIDSDDICPPLPWPPHWLTFVAAEVATYASTVAEGDMAAGLMHIAGRILDREQMLPAGTGA